MAFRNYTSKLLSLAKTVYDWLGYLAELDDARRTRVAKYAEAIADTLLRAGGALARLDGEADGGQARCELRRELGRISGYVETIVDVLEHQLDGRKLAGVKRRLVRIAEVPLRYNCRERVNSDLGARLADAEGYFRALADGLRA